MKTVLIIIIFLTSFNSFSQDFEGEIKYVISAKTKFDVKIPMKLENSIGSTSTLLTKRGAYKQETNSTFMAFQIYLPNEGKLYYKNTIESDTLRVKDVQKFENQIYEYEIIKNADTILGYICDKLIQKTNSTQQDFYYCSDLKLNPIYFKDFVAFEKNKVTEIMKSVYLRSDLIYPNLTISYTAVEVKRRKIKDEEFNLPKNQIIVKD